MMMSYPWEQSIILDFSHPAIFWWALTLTHNGHDVQHKHSTNDLRNQIPTLTLGNMLLHIPTPEK